MNQADIHRSYKKLLSWVEEQKYCGYDPYDLKADSWIIEIIRKSKKSYYYLLLRELLFEFFYSFPLFSRKIFGIKKTRNPKAVGLLTSAYLDLYRISGVNNCLLKALEGISWLNNHFSTQERGIGWGYPFNWQSSEYIPAGTPNGIVTTAVGEAYWKIYRQTHDQTYLKTLIHIGDFLFSLPKDNITANQLCFSYTPLFRNHVHNLNLFVAEFLFKVGVETRNEEWLSAANSAVNYTLADQAKDGSFDYNGPPEEPANFIDHYHTGFVLRMLFSIWKLTGRKDVYHALEKGYKFYMEHFFKDGHIPKLKPDRTYRIDIHSCAEAVICLCTLSELFPEAREKAEKVLHWTIRELQDKKGYFYYGILKSRLLGFKFKSKIPYFRWGQAWMMKAFATYFKTLPAK